MQALPKYRYRLTFSKGHALKYVAHLDLVLSWTRTFRRAGIPLAYSKGFNPNAKIKVASGLPVGTMGSAELMDIYLTEPMPADEILMRVKDTLPAGFGLSAVVQIEGNAPGLQASLLQADYRVTVETDLNDTVLATRTDALLSQKEIIQTRIRRKKEERFDLRPLLHRLKLVERIGDDAIFEMRLSTGQQGNLRPEAVLSALDLSDSWYQIERTKLIFNI